MRKKKKQQFILWHYIALVIIAIFFYVWQQGFIVNLGYQIQGAETEYNNFLAENRQMEAEMLFEKSVSAIRARIRYFNLPLVEPKSWNIYYLNEVK